MLYMYVCVCVCSKYIVYVNSCYFYCNSCIDHKCFSSPKSQVQQIF